jgi:small conductance mechanosensitive channel
MTAQIPPQDAPEAAPADTTDTVGDFGRQVGDAADALASGDVSGFWMQVSEGFLALAIGFVPLLIRGVVVFALFYIGYRIVRDLLGRVLRRSSHVDRGLESLLMKTFRIAALSLIFVLVLAQFGVNVTSLIAGLSIVGLAVGFAARDTLENFISGVTILMDRPFRVGDQVEVDGTYGTVEEISLRSTRLRTLNNTVMVMPNIQMVNQKLINHAMLPVVRVQVPFGIAYKEDMQAAREAVLRATQGDDRMASEPAPAVVVTELGDSSVNMELRFFLADASREVPMRFEYVEKTKRALDEVGIEIPFPHLQLFIDEAQAFENAPFMRRSGGDGASGVGNAPPPATPST